MADVRDSKSRGGNLMRVRLPPSVPKGIIRSHMFIEESAKEAADNILKLACLSPKAITTIVQTAINKELSQRIKHCDRCGGDWVDNGLQGECHCTKNSEQIKLLEECRVNLRCHTLNENPEEDCKYYSAENVDVCTCGVSDLEDRISLAIGKK